MGSAIQNALKRKQELQRELEEIDIFISVHNRFATDEKAGGGQAGLARKRARTDVVRSPRTSRPAGFANLVDQILGEVGRPMTRAELVAAIEARGVSIPSGDKQRYLGTILWRRQDLFSHVDGVGYARRKG
ncbi:MAG: hypothetical protein KIT43_16870 [Bauldia sp.]|nr:hypothetical protein [Bauldia sp.]MCW5717488.1 hypothetical protein [Bauldia sp.]